MSGRRVREDEEGLTEMGRHRTWLGRLLANALSFCGSWRMATSTKSCGKLHSLLLTLMLPVLGQKPQRQLLTHSHPCHGK